MKYKATEPIICKNCHEELEGIAGDYVIPKRTGSDSYAEDQCEHCDWLFSAQASSDGTVNIESLG